MTEEIHHTLAEVTQAMSRFTQALDRWVADMKKDGTDQAQVTRFTLGAQAMKDSSNIYLAWAHHIANGMPEEDETPTGEHVTEDE